jgi:ankyrin repeat protein
LETNYSTLVLVHKNYLYRSNKKWDAPNLDLRDNQGNTALMLANEAGHNKAIELLKAAGASPVGLIK